MIRGQVMHTPGTVAEVSQRPPLRDKDGCRLDESYIQEHLLLGHPVPKHMN